MIPRKQQIAIATACGWKCAGHPDQILATKGWQFAYQFVINPNGEIVSHNSIPNYPSDKNAMQIAKKVLWDKGLMLEFINLLVVIICYAKGISWSNIATDDLQMFIANATAEQEAEAFLKVLRLWEEEQIPEPSFHDYCKEDAQ